MNEAHDSNFRFRIDPRQYPKDKTAIGCLTVWGTLMLAVTVASFYWRFWAGAVFGGMMFLGVIPYTVVRRNRGDVLEVTSDFLNISKMNPASPGFRIRRDSPLEITLEHVEGFGDTSSIEATSTVNLWDTECGFRRRTTLGMWLSEEAKSEVLKDLERFLIKHGFTVKALNKRGNLQAEQGVDDNPR